MVRLADGGTVKGPQNTTLLVAIANAVFCAVVTVVYVLARRDPVPAVRTYLLLAPSITTLLWLQQDARRHHLGPVQDWGFLMWFGWIVMLPWHAFKSRGRRGWLFLLGVLLLWVPTYVTAGLLSLLVDVPLP